ncbi:hypothetical protein VHEMI02978 [[Torrubiella] hemipterigena]|uniref:Glucosamine 6-phosphate N-acetyltransferase n=1 Tax=[Torrubiella] hemipterigena TaxID=1531966 RepID=A0A0A1TC25_9HYPO|nr:hypothetical protein VHEMI02978 [[Torrubiella] hemipterigena]
MAASQQMYPASYIGADVSSAFPEGFTVRPMEKGDFAKGFLKCLEDLTFMGNVTEDEFNERWDEIYNGGKGPYYYVVLEFEGRIVGTGIVVAEKKFIHNRAVVGHIEEVCIAKQHQGKGLGLLMMRALNSVAESAGCTKTILNCSQEKEKFYEKCGYTESGMEMVHYITDFRTPPHTP